MRSDPVAETSRLEVEATYRELIVKTIYLWAALLLAVILFLMAASWLLQ